MTEPKVIYATVREGGPENDPCWDIECRFDDGQKFAAIEVDHSMEKLAHFICDRLNDAELNVDAAKRLVYSAGQAAETPTMNDHKIKAEQVLMREMIEEAQQDDLNPIERAAAMFMEADTYLRSQGITSSIVPDA